MGDPRDSQPALDRINIRESRIKLKKEHGRTNFSNFRKKKKSLST